MRAADPQRIDTLLALAFTFDDMAAGVFAPDGTASRQALADERINNGTLAPDVTAARLLAIFDFLPPEDRVMIEERAARLVALPAADRARWIEGALRRGLNAQPRLDEHVHPSHVVARLRREPPHIRRLVLRHLPASLAVSVAAALGCPLAADEGADGAAFQKWHPAPEVVDVVRRSFLGAFVPLAALGQPTALDRLSGVELRRLIRLLGVRETALACRGIEAVGTVASFLRRFGAEDARAVASHIASLTEVSPARVRRAERTIRQLLERETDAGALLYRAGLRVLAADAGWSDGRRLDYTLQKLPVEAADELRSLVREHAARRAESRADAEVERLAAGIVGTPPAASRAAEPPLGSATASKIRA